MTWTMMVPVSFLLFRAVYTDIKKGIIENRLIVTGLITGLVFSGVTRGAAGLLAGIKYAVVMFTALFFLYLLKGIGAGDVKLLCVLAAFFGKNSFEIVVIAFFAAAVIAIVKMIIRFFKREKVFQRGETLKLSIPIAFAAIAVFLMEVKGCGL